MPKKFKSKNGKQTFSKKVMRVVDSTMETKNVTTIINYAAGSAVTSWTPTAYLLCQVAQGSSNATREGNQIRVKKIQVRINATQTIAGVQCAVRYIIVRVKQQPNNTAPVITNILANSGSDFSIVSGYTSGAESNKYFDIVYDKVHVMDIYGNGSMTKDVINIYPKQLLYYTGGNATDAGMGQYWLFMASDKAGGGATSPYTNLQAQFWFKDN